MTVEGLSEELEDLKQKNAQLKEELIELMNKLRAEAEIENERINDGQPLEDQFKNRVAEILSQKPQRRKFKTVGNVKNIEDEAISRAKITALQRSLVYWREHLIEKEKQILEQEQLYDSLK